MENKIANYNSYIFYILKVNNNKIILLSANITLSIKIIIFEQQTIFFLFFFN